MRLLISFLLLAIASQLQAAERLGWIGTYTTSNGNPTGSLGIYSFRFDPDTGVLSDIAVAAETDNPSFMVRHPNGRFLYSVNENGTQDGFDRISAFELDRAGGQKLRLLGTVSSAGIDPCYLSIDRSGRWLFVANYAVKASGSIAVIPIRRNGTLAEAVQVVHQQGTGPVMPRQQRPHSHQLVTAPGGKYLVSIDLGADKIFVYRFDARVGRLAEHQVGTFAVPPGSGPRHIVFSHDGHFAYVIAELNPGVITLRWDARRGTFTQVAVTSSLPDEYKGRRSSAEIVLHPAGKSLYISNRGDSNSVTHFNVGADGIPVRNQLTPSGGKQPRFIDLDPAGKFLLAANQASGELVVFPVDGDSGAVGAEISRAKVSAPVFILWK